MNDKIRWISHSLAIQLLCTAHMAILQMASNVRGEVDEVREERLRRTERDSVLACACTISVYRIY